MVYEELVTYLRANGFKTFIVSGGGKPQERPMQRVLRRYLFQTARSKISGTSRGQGKLSLVRGNNDAENLPPAFAEPTPALNATMSV